MFGLGLWEILVILAVALLIFGPARLPELARSLGRGLAEFRRASTEIRQAIMVEPPSEPPAKPAAPMGPADEMAAAPLPSAAAAEPALAVAPAAATTPTPAGEQDEDPTDEPPPSPSEPGANG